MARTIFKFKLLHGNHARTNPNGTADGFYSQGDIFESEQPLDEMYNPTRQIEYGAVTKFHPHGSKKFLRLGERTVD